jgi:uracil-DNA glycosylase
MTKQWNPQHLWEQWRDNELSWELNDRDNYHYPLFGLGPNNADVIILGLAPAYNVGLRKSDGDDKRRYVDLSDKTEDDDIPEWELEDGKLEYFDKIENQQKAWVLERLAERNNMIRFVEDIHEKLRELGSGQGRARNFYGIYFTNLQKDGYFDLPNHIAEDYDADPNSLSQDFWIPYLQREIEAVDPEVVVACGNRVAEGLERIGIKTNSVSLEFKKNGFPRSNAGMGPLDRNLTLIRSYHWSRIGGNAVQHLGLSGRESYLEKLAWAIHRELK